MTEAGEGVGLACQCGSVRGALTEAGPRYGNRVVCMCDDCQSYLHHLGRPDLLDTHGGSEIYQTVHARVRLSDGLDHLQCLRLGPRGMYRWYADCCRTPIANTLPNPRIPLAGVHVTFIADPARCGPLLVRVQGRFGHGELPGDASRTAPLGFTVRAGGRLMLDAFAGRHRPTPFFDDRGRPVVEPVVLTPEQRENARRSAASAPHAGPAA